MPRQVGPFPLQGTVLEVTFYRLNGEYRARRKTSLDKKRIKRDPAFKGFRGYSGVMSQTSRVAKKFYRTIYPPDLRKGSKSWRPIHSRTWNLCKEGKRDEEILTVLKQEFLPQPLQPNEKGHQDYMDGSCGS